MLQWYPFPAEGGYLQPQSHLALLIGAPVDLPCSITSGLGVCLYSCQEVDTMQY